MSQASAKVAMQFNDAEQQRSAATFGMWVFLATEVLFFGGMFVAYSVYRFQYPDAFVAASGHINLWAGGAMTAILLTGSLLVAMSDHAIEHAATEAEGDHEHNSDQLRGTIVWRLAITALLGLAFIGCEFYEYHELIGEGMFPGLDFNDALFPNLEPSGDAAQIFFFLFFCMTGLHALHMLIGISLVSGLAVAFHRTDSPRQLGNPLKVIGLYWHFVDIVWLFLYPLFYLVR